jgi:uncharacterized small protein (DUF1192 family)
MSSDVKDEGRLVWVEESDYLLMKESLEAENARLKAEVERLTAFTTRTIIPNKELQAQVERVGAENAHLHKGIYSLSLNVAQLKDEVERLTKAGDAMSDQLLCDYGDNPLTYAWHAAKEGKPRA